MESTTTVTVVGTGWVASAGTHIYLAVPKERRLALPNTRFMIHQPAGGAGGQWGMLLAKGSPLTECVNLAIDTLTSTAELEDITEQWMGTYTEAPYLSVE
mgnify:CR=1 FL=1